MIVTALLTAVVGVGQTDVASEQLMIYEINRARNAPRQYALDNGLGDLLEDVAPSPPLAVHRSLQASARFHASEMADFNYFNHQSDVTGDWPNKMARDAGYPLASSLYSGRIGQHGSRGN